MNNSNLMYQKDKQITRPHRLIFLLTCMFFILMMLPVVAQFPSEGLRISSFDMDVTPPGDRDYLTYDPQVGTWDMGLRAKGLVIQGAGLPIVLCAVDWIAIGNEGMDAFKGSLAQAAGTTPERVSVNVLHQHDAPRFDLGAESRLLAAGADPAAYSPVNFDASFGRQALYDLSKRVAESLEKSVSVNQIGYGEAEVFKVASNRNICDENGMVRATHYTATRDSALRAEPEGVIDPIVSVISFWNDDE